MQKKFQKTGFYLVNQTRLGIKPKIGKSTIKIGKIFLFRNFLLNLLQKIYFRNEKPTWIV